MVQPVYGSVVVSDEVTGRGEEAPVAILAGQEGFTILFQEPGRMVRYDNEWNELIVVVLPDEFVAGDMIAAGKSIWALDERQGIVLQLDSSSLKIMDSFESKYPYELIGIFEMDGFIFVMDNPDSTTRTYRGVTKAQIGKDKLVYYYTKESVIRVPMPLREADSLELKIPTADLLVAKECGIEWTEILWKNVQYRFPIVEWTLELVAESEETPLDFDDELVDVNEEDMDFDNFFEDEDLEVEEEKLEEKQVGVAEAYVEIRISQEKIAIDVCVVEWVNEISKLVRRERLK